MTCDMCTRMTATLVRFRRMPSCFHSKELVLTSSDISDQDVLGFPSPAMQESMIVPPLPGTKVGVDGERYLEILHPLPAEGGTFDMKQTLVGIHNKGKGATVETETLIYDEKHQYIRICSGAFLVGARDFTPDSAGMGIFTPREIKLPKCCHSQPAC